MDSKYSNLRGKTIFDFTGDSDVLKEILEDDDYSDFVESPREAIEESIHYTQIANVIMISKYAELKSDEKLISALKEEFEEDFPGIFNEDNSIIVN